MTETPQDGNELFRIIIDTDEPAQTGKDLRNALSASTGVNFSNIGGYHIEGQFEDGVPLDTLRSAIAGFADSINRIEHTEYDTDDTHIYDPHSFAR